MRTIFYNIKDYDKISVRTVALTCGRLDRGRPVRGFVNTFGGFEFFISPTGTSAVQPTKGQRYRTEPKTIGSNGK